MRRMFAYFLLLLGVSTAHAQVPWESYRPLGYVSDYAQILSEGERLGLESLLGELRTQYGVHVAFISIPSLHHYRIADTTRYLYELWDMGTPSANQAALLLVSSSDSAMHLYVGMGLRGILSSQWSQQLSEATHPMMAQGQQGRAAVAALTMMVKRIYDNTKLLPQRSTRLLEAGHQVKKLFSGRTSVSSIAIGLLVVALIGISIFRPRGDHMPTAIQGNDFERGRTGPFGTKKPRLI